MFSYSVVLRVTLFAGSFLPHFYPNRVLLATGRLLACWFLEKFRAAKAWVQTLRPFLWITSPGRNNEMKMLTNSTGRFFLTQTTPLCTRGFRAAILVKYSHVSGCWSWRIPATSGTVVSPISTHSTLWRDDLRDTTACNPLELCTAYTASLTSRHLMICAANNVRHGWTDLISVNGIENFNSKSRSRWPSFVCIWELIMSAGEYFMFPARNSCIVTACWWVHWTGLLWSSWCRNA